jgi:hypothetical protein
MKNMKKNYFTLAIIVIGLLSSCKLTSYQGNYGQVNQTQVLLTNSNFKILGSFKGVAAAKKIKMSIKDEEGIVSKAKANLLENAKTAGVTLTGSRTLINVTVDLIQNKKMVTATVSAEIVEFTK